MVEQRPKVQIRIKADNEAALRLAADRLGLNTPGAVADMLTALYLPHLLQSLENSSQNIPVTERDGCNSNVTERDNGNALSLPVTPTYQPSVTERDGCNSNVTERDGCNALSLAKSDRPSNLGESLALFL